MATSKCACSVAFSGSCAGTAPEERIFFLRLLFLLMKPAPKTCDSLHLAHSQRKQQDNTPGTRTRVDAMRLADQIAAALKAADVTHIFSLSGNQIMSLYDALLDHDIRIVHVRHEAAAVHMADAWAGTSTPGLPFAGPGHANAIRNVYGAALMSPYSSLADTRPSRWQASLRSRKWTRSPWQHLPVKPR